MTPPRLQVSASPAPDNSEACAKSVESRNIGDWMVTFQTDQTRFPGRNPSPGWQRVVSEDSPEIWTHAPCSSWKGCPMRTGSAAEWHLWLLGEIFGPHASLEVLLEGIRREEGYVRRLNGHFLLFAWNERTRRWHAWTDRFGTLHAYHATDGKRAALGTFFPAAAAAASRRQLDWIGLTGFFTFGFFPQDRTYLEDIRILRPASHYVFDEEGKLQKHERYWRWWHSEDGRRSYDETVAEFGNVLGEVLRDQTERGRLAVPISGGLDSRTTVALISSCRPPSDLDERFWSYSYGFGDETAETRIARRVAEARGLRHESFCIRPYLFGQLDRVMDSIEGFQDVTQCRQAAVVDELARGADFLIAAHWGDVWLDDTGLPLDGKQTMAEDHLVSHAFRKLKKDGHEWLVTHLCKPRMGREQLESLLRDIVRAELAEASEVTDPDFRMKAFKTDQWSFRWTTASLRMFQGSVFPRLPFYDARMSDFFCTVPSKFLCGRRLQIDYLKQFAPDLARIPWQAYDTNLFRYPYFHSWLLPKRAWKKAWRMLTRRRVTERNWEVQFLGEGGKEGLAHWLTRPGLRLHEFVAPSAVRTLLADFDAAPFDRRKGYALSILLTFSAWLERYG